MSEGQSKYYELAKIREYAQAQAKASQEREKAEIEEERQDVGTLARQLVMGMVDYFEFPQQHVRYFNAKNKRTADLGHPAPICREWYGSWSLGVEMNLPACRISIGLTFKRDKGGGFQVAIGRAGDPRVFPGSDPHHLYDEIAATIEQALQTEPQRANLEIGSL